MCDDVKLVYCTRILSTIHIHIGKFHHRPRKVLCTDASPIIKNQIYQYLPKPSRDAISNTFYKILEQREKNKSWIDQESPKLALMILSRFWGIAGGEGWESDDWKRWTKVWEVLPMIFWKHIYFNSWVGFLMHITITKPPSNQPTKGHNQTSPNYGFGWLPTQAAQPIRSADSFYVRWNLRYTSNLNNGL